jgi:hypothetical protein
LKIERKDATGKKIEEAHSLGYSMILLDLQSRVRNSSCGMVLIPIIAMKATAPPLTTLVFVSHRRLQLLRCFREARDDMTA